MAIYYYPCFKKEAEERKSYAQMRSQKSGKTKKSRSLNVVVRVLFGLKEKKIDFICMF